METKQTKQTEKTYHIYLDGKIVAGRNSKKGARKCAALYCKKHPANDGHIVFIYDKINDIEL